MKVKIYAKHLLLYFKMTTVILFPVNGTPIIQNYVQQSDVLNTIVHDGYILKIPTRSLGLFLYTGASKRLPINTSLYHKYNIKVYGNAVLARPGGFITPGDIIDWCL